MASFELVVVRHGAAESGAPGMPDEERPLSASGAETFQRAARGLARLLSGPVEIRPSPLLRARQSALILFQALRAAETEALLIRPDAWLIPDAPADGLLEQLQEQIAHGREHTLVLVTHQPLAGDLLGLLVNGGRRPLAMTPGEACACRLDAAGATLDWKLPAALAALVGGAP